MITVCMLGGPGQPITGVARYYLAPGHSCGLAYYTEHDQLPGRWQGTGAEALGLSGRLETYGAARLEQLLRAEAPDGAVLTKPVWRADPTGRLSSRPLLDALGGVARQRGVPLDELMTVPADRAALLGIVRRTAAQAGPERAGTQPACGLPTSGTPWVTPMATGAGASASGFTVDAAVVGRLAAAAGLDPVQLYRAADGTDPYTPALARAGGRIDIRRVGIDVTISAPKSVSVLLALADPETGALIETCHDRALTQALGYLQRHAGHALRGHHGDGRVMDRIGTDGWIAAGFTHYTSRAGDPQLHTHLVVPNLLHGADGNWSAVDSRALYRHAKTAGYLYQAALRHELSREFGVTWATPVKGMAEIQGVPREVLREFSTRRRQIEDTLERTGRSGRAAAQAACLATRQRKTHISLTVLRMGWATRASRLGSSPSDLLTTILPWQRSWLRGHPQPAALRPADLTAEQVFGLAAEVFGSEGVTAQQTGFDRRALVQALAVTVPAEHGGDAQRLEDLAHQLLTRPDTIALQSTDGEEQRWTTLELLATEYRALDLAAHTSPQRLHDDQLLEVTGARPGLSLGQRDAIRLLNGDDRFVRVLVGPAGSGKTAVLSAARDLATFDGRPVIGCALAALTAQRLQRGSGVPSSSLAALLTRLENGQPLEARSLVIVDEAGMVGTRDLACLFEHVHQAQGRVLLVGDPEQLPEIDAGGLFRHLSQPEAHPAVLIGNQRQQTQWEIGALELLRANRPVLALGQYARNDRLTVSPSREDMYELIANDYLTATSNAASPGERRQTVVLASHRADVHELNQTIRTRLKDEQRLGPDILTPTPDEVGYAIGDEVLVTTQTRDVAGRKVLNGTRGTVTQATSTRLRFQPETGPAIDLDAATVHDAVQHGYALTIYKAQGLTATQALVVSDGLTRQSAYTALSRGRVRTQLYLHDNPDTAADAPSPFQKLCDQLTRSSGDTLASQQLPPRERRPATPEPYNRRHDDGRALDR